MASLLPELALLSRPSVHNRDWLSEEGGNLLPALQQVGF
jgi:hypothetical protein